MNAKHLSPMFSFDLTSALSLMRFTNRMYKTDANKEEVSDRSVINAIAE